MITAILGLALALLTILAVILDKAYQHVSTKELKRQAQAKDPVAIALYKTAAYGLNARLLLGTCAVLFAAGSFVLLAISMPGWLAFVIIALLLWFSFMWLGSTRLSKFSTKLGAVFSSPISRILHYLHPVLERISGLAHSYYPFKSGTGLYDHHDVVDLLEWQKHQPDNQIAEEHLNLAQNSLTFGDKLVRDILTPASKVQTVRSDDAIGPVLISELNQSGQTFFPVYESKSSRVIGTLNLNDVLAAAQKGGQVSDIMSQQVFYLNEDFTLKQALNAAQKTKHDLFIVVNNFEDFAGIVTSQDIMSQLVSQPAKNEFENYHDREAVAAATLVPQEVESETEAQKISTQESEPEILPPEPSEMLE